MEIKFEDTLGIVLPTYQSKTAFKLLIRGIKNLTELVPIAEWLINFQDWSEEDKSVLLDELAKYGFRYKYVESTYPKPPNLSMCKIFNDTGRINPNKLIYLRIDDDMLFGAATKRTPKSCGMQYLQIVDYLVNHKNCGVVRGSNQFCKVAAEDSIAPLPLSKAICTGKGLFLKNIDLIEGTNQGLLVPNETEVLIGGSEDPLSGGYRLSRGYYPAIMPWIRCKHEVETNVTTKCVDKALGSDGSKRNVIPHEFGFDNRKILENNVIKYIKEHYNPDFCYTNFSCYYLLTNEQFINAGGIDFNDKELLESLTVNYNDATVESLCESIKSGLELYK